MKTAIEFVGQIHDYDHTFDSTREFGRISREKGVKAAIEWRDAKYGDDYRALKRMATEKGTDFRFPQVLSMPEVKEALEKYEEERKKQS